MTEQHVRAMQSRMMELRCEGIMARLRGDSEEANYCRASADFLAAKVLEP